MINESPDYKEAILSLVIKEGITHVDLTMKVMTIVNPLLFNGDEYKNALFNLVYAEMLVKLNYTVPNDNNMVNAMYFPRDTRFELSE